jgi:hypothetical protein
VRSVSAPIPRIFGIPTVVPTTKKSEANSLVQIPIAYGFSGYAMLSGMSTDEIYSITGIDPWFLDQLLELGTDRSRTCARSAPSPNSMSQR